MKVKVAQFCPILCDPIDYSAQAILQARILKWVAFLFSRGSSQPRNRTQVPHIAGGFFTSWATREAQEYWRGQPIPSSADLPHPGIEPGSPALQVDSLPTDLSGKLWTWHELVSSNFICKMGIIKGSVLLLNISHTTYSPWKYPPIPVFLNYYLHVDIVNPHLLSTKLPWVLDTYEKLKC